MNVSQVPSRSEQKDYYSITITEICNKDDIENCVVYHVTDIHDSCNNESVVLKNKESSDVYPQLSNISQVKKIFICHICDAVCPSSRTLRYHFVKKHKVKAAVEYFCSMCDYECWDEGQLTLHYASKHDVKKAEVLCCICSIYFSSKAERIAHERKHTTSLKCPLCSKLFSVNHHLKLHVYEHFRYIKPHCCFFCGKRFYHSTAHILHQWRHKKQKCFEETCVEEFEDESWLQVHLHQKHKTCNIAEYDIFTVRDKIDDEIDWLIYKISDFSLKIKNSNVLLYNINVGNLVVSLQSFLSAENNPLENCFLNEFFLHNLLASLKEILFNVLDVDVNAVYDTEMSDLVPFLSKNANGCEICVLSSIDQQDDVNDLDKKSIPVEKCNEIGLTTTESTSSKVVTCPDCGKLFAGKSSFRRHQTISHSRRAFKCNDCKRTFRTQARLRKHVCHRIIDMRKLKCPICEKVLTTTKHLNLHMQTHKLNKENKTTSDGYFCNKCQKSFKRKKNFVQHLLNHKQKHECSQCGLVYNSLSKLSAHMASHSEAMKKRFPCSECNLTFSYTSQLEIHRRIHTGERPYICELCGKGFKRPHQRQVHHSVVHSKKKLRCSECGKLFVSTANLFRHGLVIHCHFRRWICGVCGQNYGYSQDLRNHLLKKHEIQFNALEGRQKKSRFQVYIIPDLGSHYVRDEDARRILAIYAEERNKLDNFQNKGINTFSKNMERVNENSECCKIIIRSRNSGPSYSERTDNLCGVVAFGYCIICNGKIRITKDITLCNVCSAITCSPQHLNVHFATVHCLNYQCIYCLNLFNSEQSCVDHIRKTHIRTVNSEFQPLHPLNLILREKMNNSSPVHISNNPLIPHQQPPVLYQVVQGPEPKVVLENQPQVLIDLGSNFVPVTNNREGFNLNNKTIIKNTSGMNIQAASTVPINPNYPSHTKVNAVVNNEGGIGSILLCQNSVIQKPMEKIFKNIPMSSASNAFTLPGSNSNGLFIPLNVFTQNNIIVGNSAGNHISQPVTFNNSLYNKECAAPVTLPNMKSNTTSVNRKEEALPLASDIAKIVALSNKEMECKTEATAAFKNSLQSRVSAGSRPNSSNDGQLQSPSTTCKVCDQFFDTLPKLKRHMKIHGEAAYVCDQCDKRFIEKCNLKTHMLSHSKANPYPCKICDKTFRYFRDMKDHMNAHENLLPFVCDICQSSFSRMKNLLRHRKELHVGTEFKCSHCDKTFKRKIYLEKYHLPNCRNKKKLPN